MDDRLYLDVNRLARDTPWAHAVLGAYSLWGGLVLLAIPGDERPRDLELPVSAVTASA